VLVTCRLIGRSVNWRLMEEKGCGKPFDAYPPDGIHTAASVEKTEDAVERTYKCPDGHENTLYWLGPPKPVFMSTRR